jgi:hypothetical protein
MSATDDSREPHPMDICACGDNREDHPNDGSRPGSWNSDPCRGFRLACTVEDMVEAENEWSREYWEEGYD